MDEIAYPAKPKFLILVVDDHYDSAYTLQRVLSLYGYDCFMATTFQGALDLCVHHQFDLLITDLELGVGEPSGYELFRRLRESCGIRGIVVSGHGDSDYRNAATEAGFSAYLLKPMNLETILAAVRMALGQASAERSQQRQA